MIIKDGYPGVRGRLCFAVRKNGKIIEKFDDHNLVVDAGRVWMARLAEGKATPAIVKIGIGENNAPENRLDTEIKDCVFIPITPSRSGMTAHFDFLIGRDDANGINIHDFGLYTADNTLFSRRVRQEDLQKADDIEIEGFWEIYF